MKRIGMTSISLVLAGVVVGSGTVHAGESEAYQHLAERMDVYFADNRPRLIESYMSPYPPGPDGTLERVGFIYDNAVAVSAFVARGTPDDVRRAKLICDALRWCQDHDIRKDGRLRQAYQADQDLTTATEPRIANGFLRVMTGEQAWVGLAWLNYFAVVRDPAIQNPFQDPNASYLHAAIRVAEFIVTTFRDPVEPGFYLGIIQPNLVKVKSTEHNLDAYVLFMRLFDLTGDPRWRGYALEAKRFVEQTAWDDSGGTFWAGTVDDRETLNRVNLTLDQQPWALLALGRVKQYGRALEWSERALGLLSDDFTGFDYGTNVNPADRWYSPSPDGVWFEGTAHMVCGYEVSRAYGGRDLSAYYLAELDRSQQAAQHANGKSLVAASHDGVTTGFPYFSYFASGHIGATAWYLAAKRHVNLFWGTSTDESVPHDTPPLLGAIGNRTVNEGQLLTFTLSASDPDGDAVSFSASNLPAGATFDPATATVAWTPSATEAGVYPGVHFEVSDGQFTVSEDITITVQEAILVLGGKIAAADGPAVPNAAVQLKKGPILLGTTTTNAEGRYAFQGLPPGTYKVRPVPTAQFRFVPSARRVKLTSQDQTAVSFSARLK